MGRGYLSLRQSCFPSSPTWSAGNTPEEFQSNSYHLLKASHSHVR